MINHETPNISQFNIPKVRRHNIYTAAAVTTASVIGGVAITEIIREDPKHSIENEAQQSYIKSMEYDDNIDQASAGPVDVDVILQDQPTSLAVEQSTLDFIKEYGVEVKEGQAAVIHESSSNINEAAKRATGGSAQPGMEFTTRLDPKTGYVVSEYLPDESK